MIYGGLDEAAIAFEGVARCARGARVDLRLFGKPESFNKRRMGVALATGRDIDEARERARAGGSEGETRLNEVTDLEVLSKRA